MKQLPSLFKTGPIAAVALAFALTAPSGGAQTNSTVDKLHGYSGVLLDTALFSADAGGHTGKAGDRSIDFGSTGSGAVYIDNASFLNSAGTNDEMSFSLWLYRYDINASSAFWASATSQSRGWQAHVPWDNDNIYFDTAGCCDGGTQRISESITTYSGYTGDDTWWNAWHHFVFSKKAEIKQIWIDGVLFLEGASTSALPADFTNLWLGRDVGDNDYMHGKIDDFAVFGVALTETDVKALSSGTLPTALASTDKLLAYWDFNDYAPEGQFVSIFPESEAVAAAPNLIKVVHTDGAVAWTSANVTLAVDGTVVTPTTFSRSGTDVTLTYAPSAWFEPLSSHTATLTIPNGANAVKTVEWSFKVATYTKDTVQSRVGLLKGGSAYSANAGGHSGKTGDFAIDFGASSTGPVEVYDASFLNTASTNDTLTFSFWLKLYDVGGDSAFWAYSPTASGNGRGAQAHVPASGGTIYFDTAGCCDTSTQRISDSISAYANYSGEDSWWQSWHYFVFSKKAEDKQIWIDGDLFLESGSTGALPTDFTELFIGSDGAEGTLVHGLIDDFCVFSNQLAQADIQSLYAGAAPTTLAAGKGLLAYWNFDDAPTLGTLIAVLPAADATNASPNLVKISHQDGTIAWDTNKVVLKLDGAPVAATITDVNGLITVTYAPTPLFSAKTTHSAALYYNGSEYYAWSFKVGLYTQDAMHGYPGTLTGTATYTADKGGRSGVTGDYAIDFGDSSAKQGVYLANASFLNTAASNDVIAISAWEKFHALTTFSLFFGVSPSSSGTERGFSAHVPADSGTVYFDTAGCCDTDSERISEDIANYANYSGDWTWWTNWHHVVVQKNLTTKEVWIDGVLFLSGENTGALPTDFTEAYIGYNYADGTPMLGVIDDFAIFGTALDEATIGKLAAGTLPTALAASTKLMAYWGFNEGLPVTVTPTISVARSGANLVITWTGTLQSCATVNGSWTDATGLTSPATIKPSAQSQFYRAY